MSRRPVPSSCPVTQSYWGKYSTQFSGGEYHGATDYGCPLGTPIIAVDDGVVEFADQSWNLPGGPNDWDARWYQIKAPVGDTTKGGGRMVVYVNSAGSALINAHLSKIAVKRGQRVKAGDVIGYAGDSGNAQGVHLHISLMPANPNRNNGAYGAIDLEPFLDEPYKVNSVTVNKEPAQKASDMSKSYKLETKWTTGFQVSRSYYGYPDKPTGITIHHWGSLGQKFEDVCNFLCNTTDPERVAKPTSAHYVLQDARIACLAAPNVATYHAGSGAGNGSTVGIECRPEMSKGDVDTLVQLVYELEKTYGSMDIYFHQEWFATSCPGKYVGIRNDLVQRVNEMHRNGGRDPKLTVATSTGKPASKPAAKPTGPSLTAADKQLVTDINGNRRTLNAVLGFRFDKYEKNIKETEALKKQVAALTKKIGA